MDARENEADRAKQESLAECGRIYLDPYGSVVLGEPKAGPRTSCSASVFVAGSSVLAGAGCAIDRLTFQAAPHLRGASSSMYLLKATVLGSISFNAANRFSIKHAPQAFRSICDSHGC